jgi:HPt (histidine-containing phosphotransfer) domain-containing protein
MAMSVHSDRMLQMGMNLPELLLRVENDLDLLDELIGIFKEEIPPLLQVLRESIANREIKQVEATSHALKGMLSGLSVARAAAMASQLEQMALEQKSSGYGDVLTLLECEIANLLPELNAYTIATKT